MSSNTFQLSDSTMSPVPDGKGMRVGIVVAEWNDNITKALLDGAVKTLKENGVESGDIKVEVVPGSFELIYGSAQMVKSGEVDAVIAIGCVIRGDTPHFDYICQGVTAGLTQINTTSPSAVINGVLTVNEYTQAQDRCGKTEDKGYEFALTAIKMARLKAERF